MSLQNYTLNRDNEKYTEEYWLNPNNLHLLCLVQSPVQAPRFIIMPLLYSLASFITFISHSFDGGTKVSCLALHINHVQHW